MIKKIESISGLGIFQNFSWNSSALEEFKDKNIIYAWNYSGKTTLSRLFSSLREKTIHNDYQGAHFKITTNTGSLDTNTLNSFPFQVEVFNSDYIKDNLRWGFDEKISAISFEVGDTAKYSKRIDELNILIEQINGSEQIKGKKEPFLKDVNDFEAFENYLFTDEAKRIKNDVFWSVIEFTKVHLKKIKNSISQDIEKHVIKSKRDIEEIGKVVLIKDPKDALAEISFHNQYKDIVLKTKEVLRFIPSKSQIDNIIKESNEIYEWSKSGLNLHKANEKCSFCGNTITESRYNQLVDYFKSQTSELKEMIKRLLFLIEKEEEALSSGVISYSINDFNDNFQEEYKSLKKAFDIELKKYKSKLKSIKLSIIEKREKSIYEVISITNSEKDIESFLLKIKEINELIKRNNEFTKNFVIIIDEKRTVYKNHLVALFLKSEQYYQKEKKSEVAKKEIDVLGRKVADYQNEITLLNLRKESQSEGCAQFNAFVQSFLGRNDIEVMPSGETGKYNLMRGSNFAKNLSEGEKMAISFSHFLVLLKSFEKKGCLNNVIIFIDDPISSLDSNHVFQINSLLKETFFEQKPDPNNPNQLKWELKCKQLFVSTHNFEFFNLLKEMPKSKGLGKNRESRYFISRKLHEATIETLPKVYDTYASEYHYLFSKIVEFNNEKNQSLSADLFLIPNILRRFVEMYTLTKYPSSDEVDIRADEVFGKIKSKRILKPLHYFSHFNNIDRIGKQSEFIADIGGACKELITQIKRDKKHYKALCTVI
jgi:Uncharacterized protein conserved in bacteria